MREFVIGDIHGGYRGLVQVLERAGFDYENDKLISVGDVCDGWSQTAEAFEELLKIKNLVYIKGNHDEWTQRFLRGILKIGLKMSGRNHMWYAQGGRATYHSYLENPDLVDKHLEFIEKALLYYVDDENRIFLHAGFNPNVDLDKQYFMDVGQETEGENAVFYWDRSFWGHVVDRFKIGGVGEVWENYKEIYIGHTPTTREFDNGMQPVNIGNVWNMDTAAGYDGVISMMNIETKEVFQSDRIYRLYPDETGRNQGFLAREENR